MTWCIFAMGNLIVLNDKRLVANRIYLTFVWMSLAIALAGVYGVARSVYFFVSDRQVLKNELMAQNEKISEYRTKPKSIEEIQQTIKRLVEPEQMSEKELDAELARPTIKIPKFDPTKPYEVIDPMDGLAYPPDVFKAIQKSRCLEALLSNTSELHEKNCAPWVKEELYPKVHGSLYCGRYNYYQLELLAVFFCPLVILVLGRMWILWVFVQKKKSS
jgi:hypothetical protein